MVGGRPGGEGGCVSFFLGWLPGMLAEGFRQVEPEAAVTWEAGERGGKKQKVWSDGYAHLAGTHLWAGVRL